MSFTRSFLKATGLSDEQIQAVMEEHNLVTEALKQQRDGFKADAEKLPEVQQKLQQKLDDLKGIEDYKAKFEKEHSAFEKFKADVQAEANLGKVREAYKAILADEKISPRWVDPIIRMEDFSSMKLDETGNLADADKLRQMVREKYPEYIATERTEHEKIATPPEVKGGTKLTRDDIFRRDERGHYVLSTEERQKAIAENPQAFR